MESSNDDQSGVRERADATNEGEAEWLAEQAVLGGEILEEIRVAAAKKKLPVVAYLMALYIEYAAIRDDLVAQFSEKRVRYLEEGFRVLVDVGMPFIGRLNHRDPMYA